jgi:hypothetical protein
MISAMLARDMMAASNVINSLLEHHVEMRTLPRFYPFQFLHFPAKESMQKQVEARGTEGICSVRTTSQDRVAVCSVIVLLVAGAAEVG